jgi:putative chitinase
MEFTEEILKKCVPENPNITLWYDALITYLPQYQLDTPRRIASFIAQTCVESSYYRRVIENLNYSAKGLLTTFPSHFNASQANQYARKPEAIASRVYANRLGNGDEASKEGWKYRGRGLIQITGKANYIECSKFMFNDTRLVDTPELLEQKEYTVQSACWFWITRKLNTYADLTQITNQTKIINGGVHGLETRLLIYRRCIKILNG